MQRGDIKGEKKGKDLCLFSLTVLVKEEPSATFCPCEIIPPFANNGVS